MGFDYEKHLAPDRIEGTRISLLASFERYLKFMFYVVNEQHILFEPFHREICKELESYAKGKNTKRNLALNVPVGSGKSLLVEFFISYCFARNINNAFVYTSYNSDLITKLSKETREICTHPVWVKLFQAELMKDDRSKVNWKFQGSANRTGLTAKPMGGGITGLDAGNPNVDGFSGALIIDDPVDATDGMRYENTRKECVDIYDNKLTTRRRTPTTPTILLMQRVHKEDLTGWIEKNEPDEWRIVKIPALKNGESFWESRYPVAELEKIKNINPYKFNSQYQQKPINAGGEVIKPEWFRYYDELPDRLDRTFITADTAMKIKEHNDWTVFCCWGVKGHDLYLVDFMRGKWEAHDLLVRAKAFYKKNQKVTEVFCHGVYIEDKASGTGLIQQIQSEGGVPVVPVQRTAGHDKLTRVESAIPFIYAGQVKLPIAHEYGNNPEILSECESFQRDDSHTHDDIVDNISDGVEIGLSGGGVSILDVV